MKNFKDHHKLFVTVLILILTLFISCDNKQSLEKRESVLDRVVHVEEKVLLEIPEVPRFCDQLDLIKHRINVGDCELYVEEEGKGMPLILINGGPGGTHHYFHPWFSRMKKYARIIYYDQRGCGLSDYEPGENGYSVQQAVEDLEAIRKAMKVGKWVLLGYSYGGFLAQYYTTKYPENVSGLLLMGALPGMWVNMKSSRQQEFISDEEREKMSEIRAQLRKIRKEKNWSRQEYISLLIYNNFANGDWKRQGFYKPSPERLAQFALYEWVQDENFNSIMSTSFRQVDLTGAFEKNPIPTLIFEGKWDLTWDIDKPEIIGKNHPLGEVIMFENASHGVYEDEPDKFFKILKNYFKTLKEVSSEDIQIYKEYLAQWEKDKKSSAIAIVMNSGWGRASNANLAKAYKSEWLDKLSYLQGLLKLGWALYDFKKYEDAVAVFEKMKEVAEDLDDKNYVGASLIWKGHMLDLLGKRVQAVDIYKQAADLNLNYNWSHEQFGLEISISSYALERIKTPFERIENKRK